MLDLAKIVCLVGLVTLLSGCQPETPKSEELPSPEERMVHLPIKKPLTIRDSQIRDIEGFQLVPKMGVGETPPFGQFSSNFDLNFVQGEALPLILSPQGLDINVMNSLKIQRSYTDQANNEIIIYDQFIGNLKVENAYLKVAISPDGEIKQVFSNLSDVSQTTKVTSLDSSSAIEKAAEINAGSDAVQSLQSGKIDAFRSEPTVRKILIDKVGQIEEAHIVELWVKKDGLLWRTIIDANGNVVSNELLTSHAALNVFQEHPNATTQQIISPPVSWFEGDQFERKLSGNNAKVFLDRTGSNSEPVDNGKKINNGKYEVTYDATEVPTKKKNPRVSVQNLFYLNNLIHDELAAAGFNEQAGNFQSDNFGRGGQGNDPVIVHALDGSKFNNARFTSSNYDGFSPTMEMFVWSRTRPYRDSGLDGDIVWHEYGHGLLNRMLRNMLNTTQRSIGEATGDILAMVYYDDPIIGEYVSGNQTRGIRSSSYATYAKTFKDYSYSNGVYTNGEIYAATMWDLWVTYKANSLNSRDFFTDMIGGMGFSPPAADYIDMRDGLVSYVDSSRKCWVWTAFGNMWMGEGAEMDLENVTTKVSDKIPENCR